MAITGGIKFFDKNFAFLGDSDVEITASSADAAADFAIDRNAFTYWRSVGSDDTTTETIEITLASSTTIDRLFFIDHNWKEFTAQYHNGSTFTDFTNVVGLDGSMGSISETSFSENTAYYEFDSVSTDRIQITVTKTQTADQEKFISRIVLTQELGTLVGYPILKSIKLSRNERRRTMLSGRFQIQKSIETEEFDIDFKNYPPGETDDLDLVFTLFDREEPFLVWPCGGRRGSNYFRYTLRSFRLQDLFLMQLEKDLRASYSKNIYIGLVNIKMSLVEHV